MVKIDHLDQLPDINDNLTIALPHLSNKIDESAIELIFNRSIYCTNDDMFIQKVYEVNYEEMCNERLVIILYNYSEAADNVLKGGAIAFQGYKLEPVKFNRSLLPILDTNPYNKMKLNSEIFPYRCLSSRQINELQRDLEDLFDADLHIKDNCYEIKRRSDRSQLKSATRTCSNKEWFDKLNTFMHDHVENKFDQFEILNETFSLSEINWKTLINHALTRFKETESIKLVINSNQHPFQSCTLMGLKDLVKKEKERIEIDIKKLIEAENKQNYTLDRGLCAKTCQLLILEKYVDWCHRTISPSLEITIREKSVDFRGKFADIEYAKTRIWDLKRSLKEETFEIDVYVAEFLSKSNEYLLKFQEEKDLSCLIEFEKNSMKISSFNELGPKCKKLIDDTFRSFVYTLDENSIELIKNSKFALFLNQKQAKLKETNEIDSYLMYVNLVEKRVVLVGEKLIVFRLAADLKDFFEANTIFSKVFKENENALFSIENIKYFKLVKSAEISNYCKEITKKIGIPTPFEIETLTNEINGTKVTSQQVKLTANVHFHERLNSFLKALSDKKIIEYFQLENSDQMDVFSDEKIRRNLEILEEKNGCIIISPIQNKNIHKSSKIINDVIWLKAIESSSKFFIQNHFSSNKIRIRVVNTQFIQTNQTDLMIVSVDSNVQPVNKESKQLLNGTLINELKLKKNDMLLMTQKTGQLKTNNLIACIPEDTVDTCVPFLYDCLEKCEQNGVKQLALSLICSDNFKELKTNELIDCHLNTLIDYFSDSAIASSIKEIFLFEDKFNNLIATKLNTLSKSANSSVILDTTSIMDTTMIEDEPMSPYSNIQVIYSSIIDESLICDVIVNSTSSNLNLQTGLVSASIYRAAGEQIQNELKTSYPKGLTVAANLAVTSAGKLKNKKNIFHCVLPGWSSQNIKKQIKDIIYSLLDETVKRNLKSIAFPAFGSGNLGYPKNEVPKLMFECVNSYFSENESDLKVFFVIYEKDVETVKAFKDYLSYQDETKMNESGFLDNENEETDQDDDEDMIEDVSDDKTFFKNFKSNDKKHECSIDFDCVKVRAYVGDITESQNDVILNPTDKDLHLDGNISKVLLAVGGDQISDELKASSLNQGLLLTTGGTLKCKKIIHVDVRSVDINKAIIKALKEVNEKNYVSLTLPVVGTGVMASDAKDSIAKILNSIETFVSNEMKTVRKLKQVDVCIYTKDDFFKHFLNEMQTRAKSKTIATGQSKSLFKSLFSFVSGSTSGSTSAKPTTSSLTPTKTSQMTLTKQGHDNYTLELNPFKLISDSQEKLNQVKSKLKEIVEEEIKTDTLENPYLKQIDAKNRALIETYCNSRHIRLDWHPIKNCVALKGRLANINECSKYIMQVITNYTIEQQKKVSAELTAHKIQWEYEKNDKWLPFNIYLNNQIEQKYEEAIVKKTDPNSTTEILNERNQTFIVDVFKKKQYSKSNKNNALPIRRMEIDKLNITIRYPEIWTPNKHLDLINLNNNDTEFKFVLDKFTKSGLVVSKVVSIQRIQNKRLYIQYQTHREEFSKKYNSNTFEQSLFHGTNADCVEKIWKNGFNRSYAGKNATAYGKGVYFAKQASYSHNYTDRARSKTGHGHIFVTKVLVGKVEPGNSALNVPVAGDTTVDNVASPSIFVIYHDAQAYPEYLLTYE